MCGKDNDNLLQRENLNKQLTLQNDWRFLACNCTPADARMYALRWCELINTTANGADLANNALLEKHYHFLRAVQPYIEKDDLKPFTLQRAYLNDVFGFSGTAITQCFAALWYEDDKHRQATITNLARMFDTTAETLVAKLTWSQNRFWDIAESAKTDMDLRDAAIWLSLLSGLSNAQCTESPRPEFAVWYWIGLGMTDQPDWSEEMKVNLVLAVAEAFKHPVNIRLQHLKRALDFTEKKQYNMVGFSKLIKEPKSVTKYDVLNILAYDARISWIAAEELGLTLDEALSNRSTETSLSEIELPPTVSF